MLWSWLVQGVGMADALVVAPLGTHAPVLDLDLVLVLITTVGLYHRFDCVVDYAYGLIH